VAGSADEGGSRAVDRTDGFLVRADQIRFCDPLLDS